MISDGHLLSRLVVKFGPWGECEFEISHLLRHIKRRYHRPSVIRWMLPDARWCVVLGLKSSLVSGLDVQTYEDVLLASQ